jgi:UDP-glucose 4-epimerase
VYGVAQAIPIQEDHPTEPINSYGICKLAIEKYLQLYWRLYGVEYRILRIANAYGERQPVGGPQGVIGAFLQEALEGKALTVWGDGSVVRDYVYAGDVARAMTAAAVYTGAARVFNIGAGEGHSINEVIAVIQAIVRQPLQIQFTAGRPFDVPINVLDISRAKEHLQWHPAVGLAEGIGRAHRWLVSLGDTHSQKTRGRGPRAWKRGA